MRFLTETKPGSSQAIIRHVDRRVESANEASRHEMHVVVVTTGGSHLIQEAKSPPDLIHQFSVDDNPKHLGFLVPASRSALQLR
ncbi:MAG: hypothetical protein GY904_22530 [Planctomycetaceae bacterium]|nr:hypothetical protein [Planctomycetaceae bacterium]